MPNAADKNKMDINKHFLVPKHSKLSELEKEKLLKKYNVDLKLLPRIFKDDSAISKLGAKPGEIIKIERDSKTAGKTAYYRVVVDG